jgi:holin-like protein
MPLQGDGTDGAGALPSSPTITAPGAGMNALRGLALLLLLQAAGEALTHALSLPFPGPVVGLALLLPALALPWVRPAVQAAAELLLGHLSLLFVPVGVGVITHLDLVARYGLRLLAVIVLSTWIGMAVTALVLRALLRGGSGAAASATPVAGAARHG